MSEHIEHVSGGAAPGDLETLLQAIYLRFTSVRRDEDLFKSFKLLAVVFADIEQLKTRGPDASDLQKVQQTALQSMGRSLKENAAWAALLEGALLTGTDPAERLAEDGRIGTLTVADIQAAPRLYLNTGNYVQVVMNPVKWWRSGSGQPAQ